MDFLDFFRTRIGKIILLAILAISIIVLLVVFYLFDPEKYVLFPKCPFYTITGLQCPSCGSQRALHSLLHLQIGAALKYNFFLVISLPYATLLVLITWIIPKNKFIKIRSVCYHPFTVNTYIVLLVCWWIFRNLNL